MSLGSSQSSEERRVRKHTRGREVVRGCFRGGRVAVVLKEGQGLAEQSMCHCFPSVLVACDRSSALPLGPPCFVFILILFALGTPAAFPGPAPSGTLVLLVVLRGHQFVSAGFVPDYSENSGPGPSGTRSNAVRACGRPSGKAFGLITFIGHYYLVM